MPDEFVKKEVFDARMDRMEALLEKTLTEMKMDNEKLRSEMRENNTRLEARIEVVNTRIDAMSARIDSVQTTVYWGFALMGLILAFTTFAPALLEFVKGLRRPAVVLDTKLREEVAELRKTVLALVEAGKIAVPR